MSDPEKMATPDDQLHPLDERAAAAAADLAARAASRPVPAFDPHQALVTAPASTRPHPRRRILAVAAVIVALAAVGGVLVARSGPGDDDDKATVISGDPRPFVAGDLPEGFQLGGVGEIDAATAEEGTAGLPGPMTIYGPSEDDPQLGISAYPTWDPERAAEDDVPTVEVGDRTASVYDGRGIGNRALIVPVGDGAVALMTRTMDEGSLRDLAAQVTTDGDGRPDLHGFALPDGWQELGQVPDPYELAGPMMQSMGRAAAGHYAVYLRGGWGVDSGESAGSSDGATTTTTEPPEELDDGMIQVSSTSGTMAQVHATAVLADEVERVTVRGHEAVLTTPSLVIDGPTPRRSVAWVERPGELVTVSGSSISKDELLAVAEDVEPVTAATWKDLVERSQMGEFDPANADDPPAAKVGEGRFPDGSRWLLSASASPDAEVTDASASLSVAVVRSGGSSSSSTSGMGSSIGGETEQPAIFGIEVMSTDDRTFAGALVVPDVDRVEQQTADGTVETEPEIVEGGGYRGFATELTTDTAALVAFAADGTELGRLEVSLAGGGVSVGPGETTETTMGTSTGN